MLARFFPAELTMYKAILRSMKAHDDLAQRSLGIEALVGIDDEGYTDRPRKDGVALSSKVLDYLVDSLRAVVCRGVFSAEEPEHMYVKRCCRAVVVLAAASSNLAARLIILGVLPVAAMVEEQYPEFEDMCHVIRVSCMRFGYPVSARPVFP